MTGRSATFATAVGAVASAAVFSSPVAARDDTPEMIEPSSVWALNYAENSCRLARTFGKGDDQVALAIDAFGPGGGYQIIAAGKKMRRVSARGTRIEVETRFGPYEHAVEASAFIGDFGKYEPAIIIGGTGFSADPNREWDDLERYIVDPSSEEVGSAREARAEWLSISRGPRTVYLATGSMGEPLAALRQCSQSLLTGWGLDAEANRSLTRQAMPKSDPASWLVSDDYPVDLVVSGVQGTVRYRLTVGAGGKAEQCDIQGATGPEGFEAAVCKALMQRAEFAPALDAKGEPIKSYFAGVVNFQLADS